MFNKSVQGIGERASMTCISKYMKVTLSISKRKKKSPSNLVSLSEEHLSLTTLRNPLYPSGIRWVPSVSALRQCKTEDNT